MMQKNNIFLDIETVPGCQWYMDEAAGKVAPPSTYTKADTIQNWWDTKGEKAKQDAIHKVGMIPAYGRIVCIGFAINDNPAEYIMADDEPVLLGKFFTHMQEILPDERIPNVRWIGHNILGFDIPYLRTRCMIHQILSPYLPPANAKPWEFEKVFDTLEALAGKDKQGYSLGNMAKLFGIPDKFPEVDGSMVWDLWKTGLHDAVGKYCANDVEITRNLFNRIADWFPVSRGDDYYSKP